ncbi:MAG: DAK2 domain-containing protein [Chloroflexota bacterium]
MPRRTCDGAGFLAAFRAAVANLEANVDEVNALNVFPVPDGDTGTNMLATVRAALEEADRKGADSDAAAIAHAISFGALMGARGNSGVITSQILGGMAEALAGKHHFNGLDLAYALEAGTRKAYKAVPRPVEGTILTVIREASAAAVAAAERDPTIELVLAATVDAAEKAVAKTPSLLPILREAKVVDSGGQGLLRLFQGALDLAHDRATGGTGAPARARTATATPAAARVAAPAGEPGEETAFGYETVYLVHARPGQPLDVAAIGAHLASIGDSVLVGGDEHLAKIHVHNERPDQVIAYGLSVGMLTRITIENLDTQASDVREAKAAAFVGQASGGEAAAAPSMVSPGSSGEDAAETAEPEPGPATRMPLGVVAVAPSEGLASVLADAAVPCAEWSSFRIVIGGQTANPSTGELLAAVRATDADELLILPNNPNIVMAARQVAAMVDRPVHVVPTRNCAEGIGALLELPNLAGRTPEQIAAAMTTAGRGLQTLQVTEAVRDATVSGHKVKKGQVIVLDPDDGLLAVDNDATRAVLAAFGRLEPGFGLVTIYYGADATLDEAEALSRKIAEAAPGLESVDILHGGQPHYRYLIAAE